MTPTGQSASVGTTQRPTNIPNNASNFLRILWLLLSAIGSTSLCVWLLIWAGRQEWSPEYKILTFIIVSVVGLTLTLLVVAVTLHLLGLSDAKQALALPEGSIRSVIAMSLLTIFCILFVFLYGSLAKAGTGTTPPLTQSQAEEATRQLKEKFLYRTTTGELGSERYVVYYQQAESKDATDLAKNGVVALVTLLTSVVSFYFGARTAIAGSVEGVSSTLSALSQSKGGGTVVLTPALTGVTPNSAASGTVDLVLTGVGLQGVHQAALAYSGGGASILADMIVSATPTAVTARFTIQSTSPKGAWAVHIQRADGEIADLQNGFTVI